MYGFRKITEDQTKIFMDMITESGELSENDLLVRVNWRFRLIVLAS